jgi:hypothetical protein
MVTHEIWIEGAPAPVLLDLEDDQLFEQFKNWLRHPSTPNGWTGTVEGRTWAINFQRIACMTTKPKEGRRNMGFGT